MSDSASPQSAQDSTAEIRARAVVPYLPGLDGLRAVAVVAVIFYHANHTWLRGGFLGVEVFFVISGYLITLLLLAESTRNGRIDLRGFWLRRARRLLPALWTLLVGVTVFVAIFRRDELGNLRGDVVAGFTYVTNWFQIHTGSSYFSDFGYVPLRHLWSLAVEEQFYLLWPLLMLAVTKVARRRMPVVGLVFLLASVGIAVLCGWVYRTGPVGDVAQTPNQYFSFLGRDVSRIDFAYLSTITRMGGLFIGAALAIWWRPWSVARARIASRGAALDVVGLIGLAGLGVMMWRFQNVVSGTEEGARGYDLLYCGGFFLVGLASVAVIAAVTHPTAVLGRVVLGNRLFVWIGQRSYGLYLYHWAIFQFSRKLAGKELTMPQFVGLMAITVVVTELSYRFVETPVRKGNFSRWLRTWRGAETPERRRHRRNMIVAMVVVAAFPVFAIVNLSTAKLKLDAISQSLVDAEDATTDLLTKPTATTQPVTTDPQSSSSIAAAPTTLPAVRIDVLAIGDSVMLGAAPELSKYGITVDAKKSRPFKAALEIVNYVKSIGALGDEVVIHLGTNSGTTADTMDAIFTALADVDRVVVLTNAVPNHNWEEGNNTLIRALPDKFPNVTVVDWKLLVDPNPDWVYDDGTHLRPRGQVAYTEAIMAALGRPLVPVPTTTTSTTTSNTVTTTTTTIGAGD
jgi:peptidoglycan/LPS O-acetylase OafA/YrhL